MNHVKRLCTASTVMEPTGHPIFHARKCIIRGLYVRKYGYTSALYKLQSGYNVQPLPISPDTICLEDQSNWQDERMCTRARDHLFISSLIMLAPAGGSGGRGMLSCPATICSHTGVPVDLLSRSVNGQTAHNGVRPTMKCQLR